MFRVAGKAPTLWHPNTGERRTLPEFQVDDDTMSVPLRFSPHESYFVVIDDDGEKSTARASNFPSYETVTSLTGPWSVTFDSQRGGPGEVTFSELKD